MRRNWNAYAPLVGRKNGAATLENSLAVLIKYGVTKGPSNPTPWFIPKGNEHVCPHKNLYVIVHSSIVHNSENVGTTQMSIN